MDVLLPQQRRLALNDTIGNSEWASNTTDMRKTAGDEHVGVSIPSFGTNSCADFGNGWVGRDDETQSAHAYRCAR